MRKEENQTLQKKRIKKVFNPPPQAEVTPKYAYVYILRCADGTLYTGWTDCLEKRVTAHNEKKGAKYTKPRTPVTLVYFERAENKSEALKREVQIKKLSHTQKEALIHLCRENEKGK